MAKKSFSIAAILKGVNNSGPVLRGLGHIRVAGKATASVLKGAVSLGGKVLTLGGLIGAGTFVAAAVRVKKLVDAESEGIQMSGRYADIMGMGIGRMQQWEFAAKRAGIETAEFHAGLMTFSSSLGQIDTGVGKAATALKKLSPDLFRHIKQAKTPTDRLTVALTALGDSSIRYGVRLAAAEKLFGGQGEAMIRLGEMGRVEIGRQMEAAKQWGLNSEDARKKQEDYEAATKDLDAALIGLRRTVGEALLPVAAKYTGMLAGWIGYNRELIGVKVAEWVDRGARALDGLIANGPNIINTLESIGEAAGTVAGAINDVVTTLGYFTGATQDKIESEYININPNPGERQRALGKIESSRNQWIKDNRLVIDVVAPARVLDEFGLLPQGWAVPSKFRPGTPEFQREMDRLVLDERSGSKDIRRLTTLDEVLSGQSVPGAEPQQSYMPGAIQTPVLAGIRGKAKIDIRVSDDRVRVRSVDTTGDGLDVTADVGERSDLSDGGQW